MNSKIIEQPKEVKPEYPCLKIESNNLVVLFRNSSSGMVLNQGTSPHEVGFYSSSWSQVDFSHFTDKIELSN